MDIKTLLIALLAAALATNLCIGIVYWTRRTYPGFGLWVLGSFCRTVTTALFMLPRDLFPSWLTIILANYLLLCGFLLNNRGVMLFRDRHISYGWEIAVSLSFCTLFAYFTYVDPNVAARVEVFGLYISAVQIWTVVILMAQRPVYFGSSDQLQAVSLGILATFFLARSGYTLILAPSVANQIAALPWGEINLSISVITTILMAVSQIMMNAQRVEYDYRIAEERLQQDIIERKKMEEALTESKKIYQAIIDTSPLAIYISSGIEERAEYINPTFIRLFGYTLDEVPTAAKWWPLAYPDVEYRTWVVEKWQRKIERAIETRSAIENMEVVVTCKDGSKKNISWGFVSVGGKNWSFGLDFTERKQAETTLNQAKMALEEAQRLARLGSWQWEIATDTVIWSEELYRIFDRDPNRPPPTYQEHSQIYTAESMTRLDAAVQQAIDHGTPYALDLELIRLDGSTKWIIGRGEPQYDAQRQVIGLRGTGMDITERKLMEETLRLSLADTERHDLQMIALHRMDGLLLACETRQEAHAIIAQSASVLFDGYAGGLIVKAETALDLQLVASWGENHRLLPQFSPPNCWALRRGEPYEVTDPAHGVLCQHFATPPEYPYLCLPLIVRGEILGLLHVSSRGPLFEERFFEGRNLVVKVSESIKLALSNLHLREALREQAIRDPLTGLFNRRYLDETLHRELHRCQRNDEPLVVAMLDIDHFKHFNDAYSHDAGDAVLRAMGDLLKGFLRAGDIACRYGGEELTVILPGSTLDDARIRLDNLRRAIMQLRVIYNEDNLPTITVSMGIAAAGDQEVDAAALLGRADVALYQAKESGRNRVVVA